MMPMLRGRTEYCAEYARVLAGLYACKMDDGQTNWRAHASII